MKKMCPPLRMLKATFQQLFIIFYPALLFLFFFFLPQLYLTIRLVRFYEVRDYHVFCICISINFCTLNLIKVMNVTENNIPRFTVVIFTLTLIRKYMSKKLELMISLIAKSTVGIQSLLTKLAAQNYYGK